MTRRTLAVALATGLMAGLLVAPMAGTVGAQGANPCSGNVGPNDLGIQIGIIPVVDEATGPLYIDFRDFVSDDSLFSIWGYRETNGVPGLQRGGHSPYFQSNDVVSFQDPCEEGTNWDEVVW